MENLGNMNESYYFEDTRILFKVFESRASIMKKKKSGFNLRRCNSGSTLSRCIKRDLFKNQIGITN